MKELVSIKEAARRLGVHASTIRAWVRSGKVPSYRMGKRFTRLDWSELVAVLAETTATLRVTEKGR